MKTLLLLPLALIVVACGSSKDSQPPVQDPAAPKSQLSLKLEKMSPEERAKYVQEHPDEISGTYAGVSGQNKP